MSRFVIAVLMITSSLAVLAAVRLAGHFPFYLSGDMDLTVLQDILLMQADRLPAHLAHPGLGMNWIFLWVHEIASQIGLITEANIVSLADAKSPIVIIAEQTAFFRNINAAFCIVTLVFAWLSLSEFHKNKPSIAVLSLLAFLTLPSVWRYNIPLIRTEIYALFFWIFSVWFVVLAAKSINLEKRSRFLNLAGFFAAVSLFTKIQVFFLLALLPVIYFLVRDSAISDSEKPLARWPTFVVLPLFLILSLISFAIPFPQYIAAFQSAWFPNKFFVLFLIIGVFLLPWTRGKLRLHLSKQIQSLQYFLQTFLTGSLFVVLVGIILPINLLTAGHYSLLNFKIIFLRQTDFANFGQFDIFSNLMGLFLNNWIYLGLFVGVFSITSWNFSKTAQQFKVKILWVLGAIVAGHILFAIRDRIQDRLWLEIPALILMSIFILALKKSQRSTFLQIGFFVVVIIFNLNTLNIFDKFRITHGIAYYDVSRFFQEEFKFGDFEKIINAKYNTVPEKQAAAEFGTRWELWKSILSINLSKTNYTLADIRPYRNGFFVELESPTSSLDYVFTPDRTLIVFTETDNKLISSNENVCKMNERYEEIIDGKRYFGFMFHRRISAQKECKITSTNGSIFGVAMIPQF